MNGPELPSDVLGTLLADLRDLNGVPGPGAVNAVPAWPEEPGPPSTVFTVRYVPRIVGFLIEHGRLPSNTPLAPRAERRLGQWLYRRRRAHDEGRLPAAEVAALDQALGPLWRTQGRRGQG